MHRSNSIESCLLAPLTKTTSGIPWASTTMCRLEPSLPLSVGFGPVSSPPRGLVPRSHQYSLGSNQSGHAHAGAPTWLDAAAPRRQPHSIHEVGANSHATAIAYCLRKVLQDAVEGGFITDGAVTAATFSGCNVWGNERLQFLPQLLADGGTRHEAAKHKCIYSLQTEVMLVALRGQSHPLVLQVVHAAVSSIIEA